MGNIKLCENYILRDTLCIQDNRVLEISRVRDVQTKNKQVQGLSAKSEIRESL